MTGKKKGRHDPYHAPTTKGTKKKEENKGIFKNGGRWKKKKPGPIRKPLIRQKTPMLRCNL